MLSGSCAGGARHRSVVCCLNTQGPNPLKQSSNFDLKRVSQMLSDPQVMTRRNMLFAGAGAVALAAASAWFLSSPPTEAVTTAKTSSRKGSKPTEISVEELMKPGPLPELQVGETNAPVTIVEYASMTCGHCANFHTKVFPAIKEKYVDTGKVRFIMREFPLDNLAAAASMLARCAGEGKTFPLISVLFAKQDEWAFVKGDPRPELLKFAKQAGFTQESFEKCLTDQKLLDDISAVRARAADTFGVNSTPTFFINGKKLNGGGSIEDFEKAFEPILKS
jgi:protein-disulfide isomerase